MLSRQLGVPIRRGHLLREPCSSVWRSVKMNHETLWSIRGICSSHEALPIRRKQPETLYECEREWGRRLGNERSRADNSRERRPAEGLLVLTGTSSMAEQPARTPSAVLVPVFRDDENELRLVLVVRGALGVHGGQLGLPGGKREPGDTSLLETALRETEEEIGLARSGVEIIAVLAPLNPRTTGFRVHPFLARIRLPARWRLAHGEITGVITPPARALVDPAARRKQLLSFPSWPQPRRVDCVALDDSHLLWGLTLRLLDAVVPPLLADEWPL
jgi:8-oxo-dGTP pyrophosphatase MutT (NUDIX family)